MRLLKYLAGPALALAVVGLTPGTTTSAQAAPAAAGALGIERGVSPGVEKVHSRRHWHRGHRHYGHRHHYRRHHYGHRHYYGRPYRYGGYYRSYSPGFYLSIGPGLGFGHGFGHRHRHWRGHW